MVNESQPNITSEGQEVKPLDGSPEAGSPAPLRSAPEFDAARAYVRESHQDPTTWVLLAPDCEHAGHHLMATGMERHYAEYILPAVRGYEALARLVLAWDNAECTWDEVLTAARAALSASEARQ